MENAEFNELYRQEAPGLVSYFMRRTGQTEVAADLVAETFAAALASRRRFDPELGTAAQWLYGIARHELSEYLRRDRVSENARRRMKMERLEPTDEALERIAAIARADRIEVLALAVDALPAADARAVRDRFWRGRSYTAIARDANTTPAAARQRVSRAVARLRHQLSKEDSDALR
jgi:RNA polymerase sigma factor (sigma-70 family)